MSKDVDARLLDKIARLKERRKAVILAHNYQPGEIQDLADFTGDSLELSKRAAATQAEVIIFCGVHFMAETAAILSPDKTVLLPEKNAGCPMADMITAFELRKLKQEHPGAAVVCYVNSAAEVKAESDYCCTSSNAVEVVNSIAPDTAVIFVPDRNLGSYVRQRTGRELILWPGYCPSHTVITEDDVKKEKAAHPEALVLAHPECTGPVRALADEILSTGGMLKFVARSKTPAFIIATEHGIVHALKKQNPAAQYYPATARAVCPNMKKITVDKIIVSLEDMKHLITVPEQTRLRARRALDRMVAVLPAG